MKGKNDVESVKCVVVGDGASGKTSMLISFSTNSFPETYVPTVFDNYMCQVMWNEQTVALQLWDTAGQEDYDNLRPLSYPETDVFLIVFDISNPTSLENVSHKWVPEVRSYCQKTPIILVGNKADLRNDPRFQSMSGSVVTQEQAISAAKQLGCVEYCECSAKSQLGLKQTFDRAMQAVLAPKLVKPSPERKKCSIL